MSEVDLSEVDLDDERLVADGGQPVDGTDHPIQSDPPYRLDGESELVEAALEELEHYVWRADTPPSKSTGDPNLNRCKEHLEALERSVNAGSERGDTSTEEVQTMRTDPSHPDVGRYEYVVRDHDRAPDLGIQAWNGPEMSLKARGFGELKGEASDEIQDRLDLEAHVGEHVATVYIDVDERPTSRIDTLLAEMKSRSQPYLPDILDELVDAWLQDGRGRVNIHETMIGVYLVTGESYYAPVSALR